MKRLTRNVSTLFFAAALLCAAFGASPAQAAYGLEGLDFTFTNKDGSPATQAGSHPWALTTTLAIATRTETGEEGGEEVQLELPEGETKDLTVELPAGFVGDPTAVPRCSGADFATIDTSLAQPACASDTAIGTVGVRAEISPVNPSKPGFEPGTYAYAPVYNLVPPPGVAAQFGFLVLNVPVTVDVGVSEDYPHNLVAKLRGISQFVLFFGSELSVWGNPADKAHDAFRGRCLDAINSSGKLVSRGKCPVSGEAKPFLTVPRSCQGPLTTTFKATSWKGERAEGTATTHDASDPPNPQGMTGCGNLSFGPELSVQPTTASAESPSGIDVNLDVEDEGLTAPEGNAESDIRKVKVTLPEGMTANPSAAEGLGVCGKAQFEAASLGNPGCPEASKLGTVLVTTPLLDEALEGALYIAEPDDPGTAQKGAENPFDSLLAAYLVIRHQKLGIAVSQAGEIQPDPKTGQLVTTFSEIPQFPLSHVGVRFREGPRAPLVTPPLCGTYTTSSEQTPWAGGPAVNASSAFTISSGPGGALCPSGGIPPFLPGFEAGTLNNNAGSYSPFYMRLTRRDGDQDMTRFDAVLPAGVSGKIAGAAKCPEASIAAAKAKTGLAERAFPSCPVDSEVGRVLGGVGVGPALTYAPGKLYLAGPFGGAPLSVVAVVPAVAGPFDAGTVVTRQALALNPRTAEVRVDGANSDPIPHILKGIPLKVRDIRVYADRPEFTLNATSCDEKSTKASLFGSFADVFAPTDDVPVALSSRYQAANCLNLGFKPRLSLKLKGGARRGDYPALRGEYRPRPGDANLESLVLRLPHSAFLEQAHIRTICTRVQFAQNACPAGAIYGKARAWTPLLEQPLEGPVYLRSSSNPLPDFVADLHGVVDIEAVASIDSKDGGIRATFEKVPDAPLSKVVVSMQGGKKGLIVNSRNLCDHRSRANAHFTGHNGQAASLKPVVDPSCGPPKKRKRSG